MSTWPPPITDPSNDSRPHTISTGDLASIQLELEQFLNTDIFPAYEKGHSRPPLTVYTFQSPDATSSENIAIPPPKEKAQNRPPLPVRCSSLERPLSQAGLRNASTSQQKSCPSPIPLHITKGKRGFLFWFFIFSYI